jgi:hypothetical protein
MYIYDVKDKYFFTMCRIWDVYVQLHFQVQAGPRVAKLFYRGGGGSADTP